MSRAPSFKSVCDSSIISGMTSHEHFFPPEQTHVWRHQADLPGLRCNSTHRHLSCPSTQAGTGVGKALASVPEEFTRRTTTAHHTDPHVCAAGEGSTDPRASASLHREQNCSRRPVILTQPEKRILSDKAPGGPDAVGTLHGDKPQLLNKL